MLHLLHLTNEINETASTYIEALLACFPDAKTYSPQKIRRDNHKIIEPIDIKNSLLPFTSRSKKNHLQKILQNISPDDTIIATDWVSPILFPTINSSNRLIHIACDIPKENKKAIKAYVKRSEKFIIVTPSQYSKQELVDIGIAINIHVIPPPSLLNYIARQKHPTPYKTEQDETEKQVQKSFLVGAVSPLTPKQGLESLIQALHSSQELLPQLRLIIVGEGPEKKQLMWLIDQLHLKRKIQIIAHQQDYQRFLTNFDVLIAPSPQPCAWNQVILHTLAQGVPVIASQVGAHPQIIEHGQTGLLFEAGNSHMLAQHLLNLYNNPDWMSHYKKTGPQIVRDQYSLVRFKESLAQVLTPHESTNQLQIYK